MKGLPKRLRSLVLLACPLLVCAASAEALDSYAFNRKQKYFNKLQAASSN